MMRRFSYRPYLFLILFFFCVISLPSHLSDRIRSFAICSFSPCYRALSFLKEKSLFLLTFPSYTSSQEMEKLAQENHLLLSQIETIREWLLYEDRIQEQLERYKTIHAQQSTDPLSRTFFQRRGEELCRVIDLQIQSLPARVIFREPASWSSTLWINRGERDNEKMGKPIIGKNSPVLLGSSVIGVVEYVGNSQSRVRLITDAHLNPSVRAHRGKEQNQFLLEHLDALLFSLELREDLDYNLSLKQQLHQLKQKLLTQVKDLYLAKGILQGTSHPLWRSRRSVLKGIGFNYNFPDAEGAARDLRSGDSYHHLQKQESVPLLLPGDLLVTTGLDGVFPPGLRVATVSHVQTLREGASSYEIEAISTAGNLDELTHIFVLAPYAPN